MPRPKSWPGRALGTLAAFVVVTSSLPTRAQPSPSDDLFHEGRALMEEGHVAEACRSFAASVALLRRGGALLNLAVCREMEGRNATALLLLEQARDLALKDGRVDRVALAEDHIHDLRSRLSWLTVRPAPGPAPPGLAIECDGEKVAGATWGAPRAVDPGMHTVVATAPGHLLFRATVVVGPAGDQQTVEVLPLVDERMADAPRAAPREVLVASAVAPSWKKPVGWAAMGIGVAAVSVGGVLGVQSVADSNASKAECLSNNVCGAAGYQKNQAAHIEANVADVTIPAGLVAAGAGLYLLLTSRSAAAPPGAASESANRRREPHAGLRLTGLAAWVTPGTARISVESIW
jgi:hypothetical protein